MKLVVRVSLSLLFICSVFVPRSWAQSRWFWQNPLPQGNTLNAVLVLDANALIAVGDAGTVMKSTDGGLTWVVQHYAAGGQTNELYGVSFVDANNGTAVGVHDSGATILRTSDGGATWTPQHAGTPYWIGLTAVSFVDANTGIAVGTAGTIVHTTDGGTSWRSETTILRRESRMA